MRITKVELFELIRKDHYLNNKSINQIAKNRHVHRRTVRQAIESAVPPDRKRNDRPNVGHDAYRNQFNQSVVRG